MNDQPLVSVVMPVYNGEQFLREALDSVLLQTYRNLEVLVVDDGSTDRSRMILEEYAANDQRVRVVVQANGGVAKARNLAIELSKGDYVAPIDADDLWAPRKIELQMREMLGPGDSPGLVYCWWVWIDEAGVVLDRSPRWRIEGETLKELIFINFTGNASVPLFRKSCLIEAGMYNPRLAAEHAGGCEDWEAALRVSARSTVRVAPRVLVGYRRRAGSMSSACDTMWRSHGKVMDGIRVLKPGLNLALYKASSNNFAMYLAGVAYWSGRPWTAIRWGLRGGLRLSLLVSPFVLRMMLFPRRPGPLVMSPGSELDESLLPAPLLPYDKFRLPTLWQAVLLLASPALRLWWWIILARLESDARKSARAKTPRKTRVWVMACWHFPVYSQTFVYREVLALMRGGFEVRFAYGRQTSRRNLPDECADLWKVRRRALLLSVTANWAFDYYRRYKPERVRELTRTVATASGWTEEEVTQHPHFRLAFTFARMADAWKADYIHTYFFYEQALFGLAASVLLDIPRGVSCYADHMIKDYPLKLVGMHLRSCDVIVATSIRIRGELEELAEETLPAAIVKPNGIDTRLYSGFERSAAGIDHVYKVVAVNRIHPKKGMTYLLDAASLLQKRGLSFVIDVLGDSDAEEPGTREFFEELKTRVADEGLARVVKFRGRQTAAQVRKFLAEADIFVAPYVELANGDKDGIPTALLEAMASGCAVVVTDAGSIAEVVTNLVDGVVVPQCDGDSLATAIELLCSDAGLRRRLVTAGAERVRRSFDVSVCEGALHARIREAVAVRDPFRFEQAERLEHGKLRIALLSYEYPPETGLGGIGTYTWYQARALVRLGHHVHVLAGSPTCTPLRTSRHDGVLVHRFSGVSGWNRVGRVLRKFRCYWTEKRLLNAWSMAEGIRQLQAKYQFDVIEMPECGGEGFLLPRRTKTLTFVRLHGPAGLIMQSYDVPQADRLICRWVEQVAIRHATRLTSCSDFLAREVRAKLDVNREIAVIYNGIDLDLFDQEPAADLDSTYGVPKRRVTVLFAGRMEPRKGIHLLGEIARLVLAGPREITFLLAGDDLFGYVRKTVLPYLEQHGLTGSVKILGKLGMKELRACARAVDIYLLPSLWENCPYACLEAMAAGRAVVCSNQGGMPELIEDGVNGLLAELGSPEDFARQLVRLIDDEDLRRRLGQAARLTVERRFRDDVIARESAEAYAAAMTSE